MSVRVSRRRALAVLAAAPIAGSMRGAEAADYKDAAEVRDAIAALSGALDARLAALAEALPAAAAFTTSARRDLTRHAAERARLLGEAPKASADAQSAVVAPRSLERLRGGLEELMHAHAEGLPALGAPERVQRLAEHMVDLSRLLTVVDLWIEMEGGGDE